MTEQQDQQKDAGKKIRKQFTDSLANLTKVLGGEILFRPIRLVPQEVMDAVRELAKEEKEKLVKSFKERAIALIHKKRDHDRNVVKLKKEFEKKEEEGMKSFVVDSKALFADLENIKGIEENYYNILMGAATGVNTAGEEEIKDDEFDQGTDA